MLVKTLFTLASLVIRYGNESYEQHTVKYMCARTWHEIRYDFYNAVPEVLMSDKIVFGLAFLHAA